MTLKRYIYPKTVLLTSNPTQYDDSSKGYAIDTTIINTTTNEKYRCIDNTPNAAVWYKAPNFLDPNEDTCADHQTQINSNVSRRNIFITPQIYFQDSTIEYDVAIPGNAFSVGPMIISGTVTIESTGVWTII
jgi:hypothetical protein